MDQEESLSFDEKHLWVREEGDEIIIGVTQYLADQLGPLTNIELPEEGSAIFRGDSFGTIEHSNEVVEDLVAPLNGEVVRFNEDLMESPDLVKDDPYGDGWLVAVEPDEGFDIGTLMTYEQYEEFIEALEAEDEFDESFDVDEMEEPFEDDDLEEDDF